MLGLAACPEPAETPTDTGDESTSSTNGEPSTGAPMGTTSEGSTGEATGSASTTMADGASTDSTGEVLPPAYEVLVNSRGTNAIFRYDPEGTFLGEFVASGDGGLISPEDVLFHPDGTILVSGFGNLAIKRYDQDGSFLGDFSAGYELASPSKMSFGPDDRIYVTQWDDVQDAIARFELDGTFVDEFTSVGAPKGLGHYWDDEGRLVVALFGEGGDGTVHRFGPAGEDLGTFIDSMVLQGPTSVWTDSGGDVLVEDWLAGTVLRYDADGQHLGTFISGMTNPEGIAFTPEGDLLIGDWGQDVVHRFDAEGNALGTFAEGDGLSDPNAVRVWVR